MTVFASNNPLAGIIHPLPPRIQTFSWCDRCQSCWLVCAMHIASKQRSRGGVRWIIQRAEDDSLWSCEGFKNGLFVFVKRNNHVDKTARFVCAFVLLLVTLFFPRRGPDGLFLGVSHRGHRLVGDRVRPHHHRQPAGPLHLPGLRRGPPGRHRLH